MALIIAGDFNASDLNDSHGILTEHLYDAWREAGSGLGNTFPGVSRQDTPHSSRPDPFGIDVPKWLIRIDYIFCTYDWQPIDARIGPWDGHSDHRPVIAELALRDAAEYGF
jgi:endonuclease/exonuclease/phosphatase (EEP) superfamily protein YafD